MKLKTGKMEIRDVVEKCLENLEKDKAVFTGMGIFFIVVSESGEYNLISRRDTKESITGGDLSGKFQLIGGSMTLSDLLKGEGYQGAAISVIKRTAERIGLVLKKEDITMPPMFPAFAFIAEKKAGGGEVQNQIDVAFSVRLPICLFRETPKFEELLEKNDLMWVDQLELRKNVEFISERMKFLANQGADCS